jgi:hypothetical protein
MHGSSPRLQAYRKIPVQGRLLAALVFSPVSSRTPTRSRHLSISAARPSSPRSREVDPPADLLLVPPRNPGWWSTCGDERAQLVATVRKPARLHNTESPCKLLLLVATSCGGERMVRRGSTVRVRQRASQRASKCPTRTPRNAGMSSRYREALGLLWSWGHRQPPASSREALGPTDSKDPSQIRRHS